MTEEVNDLVQENMEFERKKQEYMKKFKMKLNKNVKNLDDLKQKLVIYHSRNANKNIKRIDEKVKLLSQKNMKEIMKPIVIE